MTTANTNGRAVAYQQVLASHELGGAGLIAIRLASELAAGGANSSVWIPGDGPAQREAERHGLRVGHVDMAGLFSKGRIQAALANWRLAKRLRGQGRGIVHVHSSLHYGAMQWGLAHSGLKRVAHVQLEEHRDGLRWAFRRPPDLIITCARFLADHVRRALPPRVQESQRIEAVPNSVDTARFCPGDRLAAKERVGAPIGVPLVLMLANLSPHKGQLTAIRMTAELKRRGTDVLCWLAGMERSAGGAFTATLEALIRELDVTDRVKLLGFRGDGPELLRAADFFVLPSTCEGLPLSVLEAQATKVPVLAAPIAGVPEVVKDGETGFLIAADDAHGYADRVARLLQNPAHYDAVAEAAYEKVTREHNWESFCSRVFGLYAELLGDGATVPRETRAGVAALAGEHAG